MFILHHNLNLSLPGSVLSATSAVFSATVFAALKRVPVAAAIVSNRSSISMLPPYD